nr:MAG TPA: Terminase small subunit [Caudoviricetes sp.]
MRSIAITQDSRGRIVVDGYTLTPKQARFCEEYVSNGNVINEAVIKAGYSKSSPSVVNNMGLENLNKPACKAYIAELQQRFRQTTDQRVATIEERRNLLTQWIYSDDVRYNDKLKALDILNKMDAAYEQRIKMDTTINNPVQSLTTEELRKLIDNKPD